MTSLHADDAFLSYYQFSHDPFTPRVPGFKFYPAQRKSVLGQLHHLARYGQLLLLVTGPKGSGKTLLRQALVASTNKQAVQSLVLSGRESATASGVLKQIASGIEAAATSASSLLARAGQLALTGQEVYLLVDDAGHLEDQALQLLLALAAGNGEGRMHVFLFAEDDLAERLTGLSEGDESFHTIELQPYTEAETREYLSLRLDGAGQSLDLLTDDQLDAIHSQSGGWPGAINRIAREAMIDAMLSDRGVKNSSGFSFGLPRKHVLALVVVAAAVGAAWFMNTDSVPILESAPGVVVAPQQAGDIQSGEPAVVFDSAAKPAQQAAQPVIREPLAQASGDAEQEEQPGELAGQAVDDSDIAVVAVPPVEPASTAVPLPLPAVTAVAPAEGVLPPSGESKAEVTGSARVPVVAQPVVPPSAAPSTAVAPPVLKPAAKPAPKPVAKPEVQAVATAAPAGGEWYRSQNPTRVALQILGTRSESSAKAFIKQNGGEYRYYMKRYQGSPMYVVTYGVFSSRAAAEAALKTLPAKVQAGKPWPKTFASIQQEMAGAR